jgi:hypothetical protein
MSIFGIGKLIPRALGGRTADVRFGSKADMCGAKGHVRFTRDNDRESGFPPLL